MRVLNAMQSDQFNLYHLVKKGPAVSTRLFLTATAFSLVLQPWSFSMAGPNEINSVNNVSTVVPGVYYNTATGQTVFQNLAPGGELQLKNGDTLRGIETTAGGTPTGNGGAFHFYAPNGVIRIDGTVDVNALRSPGGAYMGNGGRVTAVAPYFYQHGSIYANGINGGFVEFNVGQATFGSQSRIEAKGLDGVGGRIAVHAQGPVVIARSALMDATGTVIGSYDSSVIEIQGMPVNNNGILLANRVVIDETSAGPLFQLEELPTGTPVANNPDTGGTCLVDGQCGSHSCGSQGGGDNHQCGSHACGSTPPVDNSPPDNTGGGSPPDNTDTTDNNGPDTTPPPVNPPTPPPPGNTSQPPAPQTVDADNAGLFQENRPQMNLTMPNLNTQCVVSIDENNALVVNQGAIPYFAQYLCGDSMASLLPEETDPMIGSVFRAEEVPEPFPSIDAEERPVSIPLPQFHPSQSPPVKRRQPVRGFW